MYYKLIFNDACLCQSSEADKLVKNPSQIANILGKLKLHQYHETGQYSKIKK